MSRHNVEVYRCVDCHAEVAVAPAGFTIEETDLNKRAEEHRLACPARVGTPEGVTQGA